MAAQSHSQLMQLLNVKPGTSFGWDWVQLIRHVVLLSFWHKGNKFMFAQQTSFCPWMGANVECANHLGFIKCHKMSTKRQNDASCINGSGNGYQTRIPCGPSLIVGGPLGCWTSLSAQAVWPKQRSFGDEHTRHTDRQPYSRIRTRIRYTITISPHL